MLKIFFVFSIIAIFVACSPNFHRDKRLFGEWKSLTTGMPNIYFDSMHYYIFVDDSVGKAAFVFSYKIRNKKLIAYSANETFSENNILKITNDTLVLLNEKSDEAVYYIKKRK